MMEELYSQTKIKRTVYQLAEEVHRNAKAALHIHVVMDGGFMFAADFIRVYEGKISKVSFLPISRGYGEGRVHPPRMVYKEPNYFAKQKLNPLYTHLILDVCIEKGDTIHFVKDRLAGALYTIAGGGNKYQILTCVLVNIDRDRDGICPVDFYGLTCKDGLFLTGYGMAPYRDFGAIYGIPR